MCQPPLMPPPKSYTRTSRMPQGHTSYRYLTLQSVIQPSRVTPPQGGGHWTPTPPTHIHRHAVSYKECVSITHPTTSSTPHRGTPRQQSSNHKYEWCGTPGGSLVGWYRWAGTVHEVGDIHRPAQALTAHASMLSAAKQLGGRCGSHRLQHRQVQQATPQHVSYTMASTMQAPHPPQPPQQCHPASPKAPWCSSHNSLPSPSTPLRHPPATLCPTPAFAPAARGHQVMEATQPRQMIVRYCRKHPVNTWPQPALRQVSRTALM